MLIETGVVIVITLVIRWLHQRLFTDKITIGAKGVLITGCDSGFGHGLAKRLDDCGFTVFAACLHKDGCGASTLLSQCSDRLSILQLDVTSDESVRDALEEVTRVLLQTNCALWGVVNNAGIISSGDVEFCTMKMYRQVMEINYFGMIRVTKAFLPLLRNSKGRVVNTTSVRGRIYVPRDSVYGPVKRAAEHFSDILRLEMSRFGVKVSLVEPGNFSGVTDLIAKKNLTRIKDEFDAIWEQASEEVKQIYGKRYFFAQADRMVKGVQRSYPGMDPVLDAIQDALTNKKPKYRYLVDGTNELYEYNCILARLGSYLPTSVTDYLIVRHLGESFYDINVKK